MEVYQKSKIDIDARDLAEALAISENKEIEKFLVYLIRQINQQFAREPIDFENLGETLARKLNKEEKSKFLILCTNFIANAFQES